MAEKQTKAYSVFTNKVQLNKTIVTYNFSFLHVFSLSPSQWLTF